MSMKYEKLEIGSIELDHEQNDSQWQYALYASEKSDWHLSRWHQCCRRRSHGWTGESHEACRVESLTIDLSVARAALARYSISIEERATDYRFVELHSIRLWPKNTLDHLGCHPSLYQRSNARIDLS